MSRTIAELRAMSEEQLIAEHDQVAQTTQAGVDYYLNELARRQANQQTEQMLQLTERMATLTRYIFFLTLVNVILVAVSVLLTVV